MLVADIGGSNARIGLVSKGALEQVTVFRCAEFDGIDSLLEHYFSVSNQTVSNAVIAVASSVECDEIVFTNMNWRFSLSRLAQRFHFGRLKVLNDFTALAMAIPFLRENQLRRVECALTRETQIRQDSAKGVIGAGTGLGVSGLLPTVDGWLPVQGEGGHVRYAATDDYEKELLRVMAPNDSYISAESLLSGTGLLRLYEGLTQVNGVESICQMPAEVVCFGNNASDATCHRALEIYCGIFGDVAGDLALTLNASGGMYIGGGVVNHMADFFCQSKIFRERFENRGLKTEMLKAIPTFLISDTNAALIGASIADHHAFEKVGMTYSQVSLKNQ